MANYTLDMMAAEMEAIANRMRTAQTSDKAEILAQIDAVALRSAQLTGQKAEELKARLDVVATNFEASSKDRFNALSDQLHDSVVDILGNMQELKAGQKRIKANQDSWGNRIMDGLKDLGDRIGSYVPSMTIVIEGIISLIIGVIVCFLTKDGASRVMEKVYDEKPHAHRCSAKIRSIRILGNRHCFRNPRSCCNFCGSLWNFQADFQTQVRR